MEEIINNKVKFNRKAIIMGKSVALTLPKELIEYLGGIKKGDNFGVIGDIGNKGRFIAIWKE